MPLNPINGDDNANNILGTTGDDLIDGKGGADTINGNAGNDSIIYDTNDTTVDGGAGSDTLILNSTTATTADLTVTSDQVVGGGTAINFENVDGSGSTGKLTLVGDTGANVLKGGSNDDTIMGGGGADSLYGNAGNDLMVYNAAATTIDGGTGTDTLFLAQTVDTNVDLSNAADQVAGGGTTTNFENIDGRGSTSSLTLKGDASANLIYGGLGNDTIYSSGGGDERHGDAGDDTLYYNANDTVTDGGTGNDTLVISETASVWVDLSSQNDQVFNDFASETGFENIDGSGSTGTLTITGDTGANVLKGGSGADTIHGGGGNDTISGNAGADALYGDGGDDTITYDAADTTVDGGAGTDTLLLKQTVAATVNLSNASDQVVGGGTATNFENVDGSASTAALTLTGSSGTNALSGGSGNDVIDGGTGADTISGNGGDDTITYDAADTTVGGGSGVDTLLLNQTVATTVDLSNTADQVTGGGTATGFENVNGSSSIAALTLTGDAGINVLKGGSAADTIHGGAGNDTVIGNGGADVLYGDAGDDVITYDSADTTIDGGADNDTLVLSGGTATTVNLANAADQITGGGITTGFENVDGSASTAALSLAGQSGVKNILKGGSGNDILYGSAGGDERYAGDGNDVVYYHAGDTITDGGAGSDRLTFYQVTEAQTVDLSNATDQVVGGGLTTGFEKLDASTSSGAFTVTGSAGDNIIDTGSGVDTVHAGDGNDTITGGAGADSLYGEGGNDFITYDVADTVEDGGAGNDTLYLNQNGATTVNLANAADQVTGGGATTGFENIIATGSTAALTITGDASTNYLRGGSGNDIIDGAGGADSIYGMEGDDRIVYDALDYNQDGGAGSDTLALNQATATTVNLSNTADQVNGGNATINFENVDGSGSTAALNITGDAGANIIKGGNAADTISAGDGNDTVSYDAVDTTVDGGAGNDTLIVASTTSTTIDLAAADQVRNGGITTGFENVDASASTAALAIAGTSGNNILKGGAGNDLFYLSAGSDEIYGGDGDDTVYYRDIYALTDGGAGNDFLYLNQSSATTIDLSNASDQIVGGGTTKNFENIIASSSAAGINSTGALTITGSAGVNYLKAGSGNDVIDGGADADSIYGMDGDDRIVYDALDWAADGGNGNDTLVLNQSVATTVRLNNTADQVNGGNTTVNFENVDGSGSTAALNITGDAGANIITSGTGNDIFTGGLGNDTYRFARGDGADHIVENDATVGNKDTLNFFSGVANDQLWFTQVGNNLDISLIGTNDKVTIDNWFVGSANQVESIQAAGMELLNTNVINLVNAMASMTPPPSGQTTLTSSEHAQLDPVFAANWHATA